LRCAVSSLGLMRGGKRPWYYGTRQHIIYSRGLGNKPDPWFHAVNSIRPWIRRLTTLPARGRNMMARISSPFVLLIVGLAAAADEKAGETRTVEQIAEAARPSIVVVTTTGRDGKKGSVGTGFVVSADGLIATNLHVIDEGRPIAVELADGKRHEV